MGFRLRSLIVTIRDLPAFLTLSIPTPLSFHLLIDKLSAQSPRQFLCPLSKPPKRSRPKTQRLAAQGYSSNVRAEPDGGTNITNSSVELNTGNNAATAPTSEHRQTGTPVFQTVLTEHRKSQSYSSNVRAEPDGDTSISDSFN